MNKFALALVCLSVGIHARRIQPQEDIPRESLKSLATVLLASNPALIQTRLRAPNLASPPVRTGRPTMFSPSDRTTALGMASNCLEEGCPVDLVTDLLNHLKAVQEPTAEVKNSIKDLEKQLGLDKPDKNVLEAIVQDMSRSFSTLDDKEPLGYSMKPGSGGYLDQFYWKPPKATIDLASDCMEAGCPADMVQELLSKLKAEENPSADAVKTIAEMEKLLAESKPDKNELELRVGDLLRYFSVLDDKEPLGYSMKPGKGGYASKFFWPRPKETIDLASNCLSEGCPVDLVQELVVKLKAEKESTPEVKNTIEQLEAILAMDKPDKNALEQLVTSVAKGVKTRYVTPMELMEGIGLVDKK